MSMMMMMMMMMAMMVMMMMSDYSCNISSRSPSVICTCSLKTITRNIRTRKYK